MRRVIGTKAGLLAVCAILLMSVVAGAVVPLAHNAATSHATTVSKPTALAPAQAPVWNAMTFTEAGLPATAPGLFWSVLVSQAGYSLGNNSPANIVWTLNASGGAACSDCGNYTWAVNAVPGYDVVSAVGPVYTPLVGGSGCGSTSASTGWCNITNASVDVAVVFHTSPQYTITFNETGLATGTAWSVTFNGGTVIEPAPTQIAFSAGNGTYSYSIGLGGTPAVNQSTPSSGTITTPGYPCNGPNGGNLSGCTDAAGNTWQNISFEPAIGVSVAYPVGEFSANHLPYFALPYTATWNVAVTGATLSAATTSMTLEVLWLQSTPAPGCGPFTYPCPVIYSTSVPFSQENGGGTATNGTFWQPITAANLTASTYLGYNLPEGQWQFVVSVTQISTASTPTGYAENPIASEIESSTGSTVQAAFMAITGPSGVITAPANGTSISEGITTIAGNYSGYFVVSANVTVYNAAGNTTLTSSVYAPLYTTNPFTVTWHDDVAGVYKIVLTLVSAWHTSTTITNTVTVAAGIGITYLNSSGLNIAGLGPGGSATLLILIGAIIGMIVMALVGRGLWGGSKPAPAQPWSPTSSGGTTGTGSTTGTGGTTGGTSGGGTSGGGSSGGSGGMSDSSSGGMSGGGTSGQSPPS
jgi:hypothetical protein